MATAIEAEKIARVIDETQVEDQIRLGIARRLADVLQTSTRGFKREKFIEEATKTKRPLVRY